MFLGICLLSILSLRILHSAAHISEAFSYSEIISFIVLILLSLGSKPYLSIRYFSISSIIPSERYIEINYVLKFSISTDK